MKKYWFYVLWFGFAVILPLISVQGQNGIDFNHRRFEKALDKELNTDNFVIQELKKPDSMQQSGKYFKVYSQEDPSKTVYAYVGRVNTCRAGGCSSGGQSAKAGAEYFDYFILFSKQDKVENIRVFNYQATYGFEITARGWLKQFIGYKGDTDLKAGNEIDAISGATKSVQAITKDVQLRTHEIQKITKALKTSASR